MRKLTLLLSLALAVPAFADGAKVKKEAGEAVDATKDYATEKKDEFVARIDTKLKALKADVNDMKEKTKDSADATVKDLEARQKKADEKLTEVKKAGGKAWSSLKGGVEGAVNELEKGVQSAKK
ncbi:MAG: hypothetical protein IPJ65_23435 [Archangiaceae bacterium]|nr:hypothetical protein [Archangiaceae bacterium]